VASVQDADMIIILDNGQVVAVGNHEQLMQTSSIYQEVFYSQQKGGME
jgi:ATP-binding cassette subfamily B protein